MHTITSDLHQCTTSNSNETNTVLIKYGKNSQIRDIKIVTSLPNLIYILTVNLAFMFISLLGSLLANTMMSACLPRFRQVVAQLKLCSLIMQFTFQIRQGCINIAIIFSIVRNSVLILFVQHSKTQRLVIYCHIRQRKTANLLN